MQLTDDPPRLVARPRDRLQAAAKAQDSTYATFVVTPLSLRLVPPCARLGVSPSAVTAGSLVLALAAAAAFAVGSRPAVVAGAVLLQVAFVLDCADGQLARYTGRTSTFGAWFDGMADRAKEYAVIAGLAAGSMRAGGDDVWLLAGAALTVQTFRHLTDESFGLQVGPPPRPHGPAPQQSRSPVGERLRSARWARSAASSLFLPIGERYLLVSVAAVLWGARVTFELLLIWGILAGGYVLVRKVAASRRRPGRSVAWVAAAMRDDGPFTSFVRRAAGPDGGQGAPGRRTQSARTVACAGGGLAWLAPPATRLVEYGLLLTVAVFADGAASPACYALVAVCAYHHYDIAYRIRHAGTAPARLVGLVAGGWDGRLLIAVALAATGAVTVGYLAIALASAVVFLAESVRFWVSGPAAGAPARTRDRREAVSGDRTGARGGRREPVATADDRPAEGVAAGLR